MKKRKIILHTAAVNDVAEIWLYTLRNWSVEQADRYHGLIYQEIEFCCRKPETGKNFDHIRAGYRASKVKSHLNFYIFSQDAIEIIRILHEGIDIPNRLEE